mgnify:CR=1 FL=1
MLGGEHLELRPVVSVTSWVLRRLAVWSRRPIDEAVLGMLERRLVLSGWPHQSYLWVNLHMARFVRRVRRGFDPRPQALKKRPQPRRRPLRIGVTGPFSGLLGFPRELFEARPATVVPYVFDLEYRGALASYLRDVTPGYFSVSHLDGREALHQQLARLAEAINACDLDMLVSVNSRATGYALLDSVTTPCIANYCTGSDLMHHEKVDLDLYWQPEADYLIRGSQLFCCTTERLCSFARVRQVRGFFDRRGVAVSDPPRWKAREPLVVFHGSLDKLAEGPEYLATVFDLLVQDRAVQFIFMGKDNGTALNAVMGAAKHAGVSSQVHYEGQFSAVRHEDGGVHDLGWSKMLSYLRRARLAPNPWPMGGASSRFEGYLAGTPSVHMGLRLGRESWRRRQPSVCDLPVILVEAGTATTIPEYRRLCERCLYEEAFADEIIAQQLNVAIDASDPVAWWHELEAVYDEWCGGESSGQE